MYRPRPPPPPLHRDPQAKAERLAELFASRSSPIHLPPAVRHTQTHLAPARRLTIDTACNHDAVTDTPFIMSELEAVLHSRPDTTTGQDQLTYSMLNHLGPHGKASLLSVFNLSLSAGKLPSTWKMPTIHPIPKPKDPGSLRPISLLSCMSKTMERMVLARLQWQVGPFHPQLFTFQGQRSTTTCLITLLGCLRSRKGLVVFLDLEKVFELASPLAILYALTRKGVDGLILRLVRDFLSYRSARVQFQECFSRLHTHLLGTPHGSCLT